jgi:hypothetical protein
MQLNHVTNSNICISCPRKTSCPIDHTQATLWAEQWQAQAQIHRAMFYVTLCCSCNGFNVQWATHCTACGLMAWQTDGLRTDGLTDWWPDGMMAWRTDELTNWWPDELMAWRTDGLTNWWPDVLMAWRTYGLTNLWPDVLMAWRTDGLTDWWPDELMAWSTDGLTDWWPDGLMAWPDTPTAIFTHPQKETKNIDLSINSLANSHYDIKQLH